VCNFWVPRIFSQSHLKRWAWLKIQGTLGKNSHNQSILIMSYSIFKSILENWIVYFVAASHFILHPKAVRLKGRLFKDGPRPLRSFLHGFSFQVQKQDYGHRSSVWGLSPKISSDQIWVARYFGQPLTYPYFTIFSSDFLCNFLKS
jgi:hypothetical protein